MNMPVECVKDVLNYMKAHGFTLMSFLSSMLTSIQFVDKQRDLQLHILHPGAGHSHATIMRNWILGSAEEIYKEELEILMEKENGLYMNASKLHLAQLEQAKISILMPLFKSKAPALWVLFQQLLVLESKPSVGQPAKVAYLSVEMGAGRDEGNYGDHVSVGTQSKGNYQELNHALLKVKGVVIMSIIMNSSNNHCNALQVKNSFYLAASNASKSVCQWATHAGLAVSLSSANNLRASLIRNQRILNKGLGHTRIVNLAYDNCNFKFSVGQPTDLKDHTFESITTGLFFAPPKEVLPEHLEYAERIWDTHPNNPNAVNVQCPMSYFDILPMGEATFKLAEHCQWHVTSVFIERYFPELRSHLIDPPSTFQLPTHRTLYSTAEAVYAKASTINGNIDAIMSLLEQSSIVNAGTFEKYAILVHGDLGTVEKIEAILHSRWIEESTLKRMHYLVPIYQDSFIDPNGLYKRLCMLFPNDHSKLNKPVPPFRMMNDGLNYVTQCTILDVWAENVGGDLEKFITSKPSLEEISQCAYQITTEYFETKQHTRDWLQRKEQDQRHMNQVMFNRDAMYYHILMHAMNFGMVDVVINVLAFWIPIFQGCGKHKYVSFLSNFLFKLHQYPAPLQEAIKRYWLCNPLGKEGGFQAIDWLVELMNLYIKVVYSGTGSGKTIEYIISQSSIIQSYRDCIEDVEADYHLPEKTLHHVSPNIGSRLVTIQNDLRNLRPHKYEKGQTSPILIEDHFQKGLQLYQNGTMWGPLSISELQSTDSMDDDTYELDAGDLAA
ncbi:uncharacterized protein EI90DRAFT_3134333 [Cantharellus anzutake]|uniref:uncharacterized protein n=1 Tax=Cantharellus anzutake TaxID=1750568 RepID=UPI00190510F6|nr:uncharacterized protein EI90DRAFT_3134333 [Cantharellus anzutake]KAF8316520.1 hypothetical protein EI90DRAFT_3134333 [Cantharellus anzutake]